jgi:hypothetical protein
VFKNPPTIGFYSEAAESHLRIIKPVYLQSFCRHTFISAVFQGASSLETFSPRPCQATLFSEQQILIPKQVLSLLHDGCLAATMLKVID